MRHAMLEMRRQWLASFGGVMAIAVALLVPTVLTLAGLGMARFEEGAQAALEAEVILTERVGAGQARALAGELRGWEGVAHVEVRDPARNKSLLERAHGELGGLDAALLPSTLRVSFHDPAATLPAMRARLQGLSARGEVDAVEMGSDEVAALVAVLRPVRGLIYGMAVFVGLVGLIVVANALGLGMFRRRAEIEAMRHVGAADRHVVWPFLAESFWLGLFGGALSAVGLAVSLSWFGPPLSAAMPFLAFEPMVAVWALPVLLLVGVLVSWAGAVLSLRVYLRQVEGVA